MDIPSSSLSRRILFASAASNVFMATIRGFLLYVWPSLVGVFGGGSNTSLIQIFKQHGQKDFRPSITGFCWIDKIALAGFRKHVKNVMKGVSSIYIYIYVYIYIYIFFFFFNMNWIGQIRGRA